MWHDIKIKNPTGNPVRMDRGGNGRYGAPRSYKDKNGNLKRYRHRGTDFECLPGQDVLSPIDGTIVRLATPYADDDRFSGLVIENDWITLKLFYVAVSATHQRAAMPVGRSVRKGEKIGPAQDISHRYPGAGVTPHVHLEITSLSLNPEWYMDL